MSLLTYEQARPYAKAIANAVTNRTMPPWHADAPAGTFHNERSLTDRERQTLTAWAAGGALNGDPNDLPAPPTFSDGWALGKPDVVLEMQEDYRVPAKGTVQYEWFYIPTNFTEAKWVKSIEIRPGNRSRRPPRARFTIERSPTERRRQSRVRISGTNRIRRRTSLACRSIHGARPGGDAAAAHRDIRTRHESSGGAGRYGVSTRARRHPRAADALHRDRTADHRPHEGRHHVRDRTVAARSARAAFHEHDA